MKTYVIALLVLFSGTSIASSEQQIDNYGEIINSIIDSQLWGLDTPGIGGTTEPIDRLGEALAHGDFNDDGWQDLAVGIPYSDFFGGAILNTGTVLIIYGTANGLATSNHQFLYQTFETDPPNLENTNGIEANDFFGTSLASGDFNCDGFSDLVVGTPNESYTIGGQVRNNAGAINVFYGSASGFPVNGQGSSFFTQGTGAGPFDFVAAGDRFGWAFAVGNFNGDIANGHFCQDFAVSSPFEDFGNVPISDAGIVHVYYGAPSGVSGDNRDTLAQNTAGVVGEIENNDQFGLSLAAGRFRETPLLGPAYSDLAVGIPGEDIDGATNAGAVQVFNGAAGGLQSAAGTSVIWSQSGAIDGAVEANDRFGTSLTTGDFNADQATDLAVGVPREHVGDIADAGSVNIIYGSVVGLTSVGNILFNPSTPNIGGVATANNNFGETLASGDLNYDFYPDLVVGTPRWGSLRGAFNIIYGGPNGLTAAGSDFEVNSGFGDEMGYAMTVANFGNGPELAVGLPGYDSSDGDNDSGIVEVFEFENPDIIFEDGFDF